MAQSTQLICIKKAKDKYLGPAHVDSHPELMVTLNLSLLLMRLELAKQGLEKAKGLSEQCSMFSLSLQAKAFLPIWSPYLLTALSLEQTRQQIHRCDGRGTH